jgi:hypothetical protein
MSDTNTGGPAFPCPETEKHYKDEGMTLRQYAAIKLKVPDSGTDWLDDMICKSQRDDFAAKAMHAALMTVKPQKGNTMDDVVTHAATTAYLVADAMIKARNAK